MLYTEAMFNYMYTLYQYARSVWPASIFYGYLLTPPSEDTKETILKIISLLKCVENEKADIFKLLTSLPVDEDWLNVVDDASGYDILQHAVLFRCKDVIQFLLSSGCDPDRYTCSPPVHLAAYTGQDSILQLLLDSGSKANLRRGMCFPKPHVQISYETRYFGFTHNPVYLCGTQKLTPIQCAIRQNNLPCVQTILKKEGNDRKGLSPHVLLMYACTEGAPDCIQYFVDKYPECINRYLNGDTPLLAAVPWGEQCATILLKSGADVHLRSDGIQETALHRLYRQNIDGLFTIYDTTKYLLTTGIEQEVNAYTHLGETPLHMLVSHVSYTGGNYVDSQRQISRAELQESYQSQVVAAIQLLLEFNADPHLLNRPGLTSLSRMLHIGLKAVHQVDACVCVQTSQPDAFIQDYRHGYNSLARAMEVLFKFGSQANFACSVGHTPMILLLQILLYDDMTNVCNQHKQVLDALEVLLINGARPNISDGAQGTAYSLISAMCQRCFQTRYHDSDTHSNPSQSLREQFANVINDILVLLLRYGLEPNYLTTKLAHHYCGGAGNGLIELVKLAGIAASSFEFELVEKWIRTLLQWGADPDLEPYPSEPIICHCQSSIFLKKLGTQPIGLYIHEVKDKENLKNDAAVQRVLMLFYSSMEHMALHDSLNSMKSFIHLQSSTATSGDIPVAGLCDGSTNFLMLVSAMCEKPRSLKEIARVVIYKSLQRQLAQKVNSLPLPTVVKRYLLDIST
uniref:SOCS box domain-containing protein n=1 Tax=Arion vulgaris TaxID=1028688 RepID=A0A0B7A141_9EUPU